MALLLAVLAGVSNACVGVCAAGAERRGCRPGAVALLFLGIAAAAVTLALPFSARDWGTPWLWLLSVTMGGLYVAAVRSMQVANGQCPPALVWSLANMAMVVPIGLAPALLAERWRRTDALIGLAFALLLGAFLRGTNQAGERPAAGWGRALPALAVVFLSNGLLMLGYKLKGSVWPTAGTVPFAWVVFSSGAVLELLLQVACRGRVEIRAVEWRWGLLVGLSAAGANLCLIGAAGLPAVVLFPLVQGIGLSAGALLIILCFHERVNRWKLLGFAMAGVVIAAAVLR